MSRFVLFASACAALVVVSAGLAQPPGGGYGRDRGGSERDRGRGGFSTDPNERFNQLSGGKDVIVIDQLDERTKFFVNMMAQRAGITNGQITRDQYTKATESFRSQMGDRFRGMGGGPGGGGPTTVTVIGGPGGMPSFGRGGERTAEQLDGEAESSFRRHDRDNDGMLRADEMSSTLRTMWEKFDANKDGAIDLNEYKSYFRDRQQARLQDQGGQPPQPGQPGLAPAAAPADGLPPAPNMPVQEEEDRRPVVYRLGKLPKELPAWFADLDTDKDGQVGLYEWVKGSRSVEEFREMDRNDDGLLTVEEVLGFVRGGNKHPGDPAVTSTAGGGEDRGRFGRGGPPSGRSGDSRGFDRSRWGGGPPGMGPPGFGRSSRSGDSAGSPTGDSRSRGESSGREYGGPSRSRFGRGSDRGGSDSNGPADTGRSDAPKEGKDKKDKRDKKDRF